MSARASWVFVLGTIAAGIGASYALGGSGVLASAGAYFAIVLIGAIVTTRKTAVTAGGAIGRFVLLGIVGAIAYFCLIHHAVHEAATSAKDVNPADAEAAGAVVGSTFGAFVAVAIFIETTIAATIGALVGARRG